MTTACYRIGRLPLVVVALLSGPAASVAQPAPLTGLDAWVEREMQRWQIPGLSLAIVKGDSVVYARGFGVRRLGEPGAVDEHTLFGVASTTKAMTAATLAMLVDEGRLGWDDPVDSPPAGLRSSPIRG
jgi:CubicO group peptidase (beta-lactamase class C family)